MERKTKNQIVRELVSNREYIKALQICKDWDYVDPTHRDTLRRGYECFMYPQFYRQLGYDPDDYYRKAVRILIKVYGSNEAL